MIKEKLLNKEMRKERLQSFKKIDINLFPQLLLIILITITTGCGKNNFDKKIFTETVEKHKFLVVDLENTNNVETIAVSNHYEISLFTFSKKSECDKEYKSKLNEYKNKKVNLNEKNKYFYIENKNIYTLIYKINNYYIEVEAPKTYKKEIKNIIKEMNLKL